MTDTAIIGRNIEVLQTSVGEGTSPFSWGAAVAGAIAATAVTFILLSLGSGIGFVTASPYSGGPSAKTLTALGAIWIVLSQAWGYAVGGYLAGRLRSRGSSFATDETNFRDGAHGFVAWALGVVLTVTMVALGAAFGASLTAHVGATLGAGAAGGTGAAAGGATQNPQNAYYVDSLFRTAPRGAGASGAGQGTSFAAGGPLQTGSGGAPAASPQGETPPAMQPGQTAQTSPAGSQGQTGGGAQTSAMSDDRGEAVRIFASGMRDGKLSDDDRAHLGRVVQARTGMTPEEANRRVDETVARASKTAKDAADAAAKAASYFAFWSFMALLFGAVAATVGGIVGGNQRDDDMAPDRG